MRFYYASVILSLSPGSDDMNTDTHPTTEDEDIATAEVFGFLVETYGYRPSEAAMWLQSLAAEITADLADGVSSFGAAHRLANILIPDSLRSVSW